MTAEFAIRPPRRVLHKATVTGVKPNGDPIWTTVPMLLSRDENGWHEEPAIRELPHTERLTK